MRELYLGQLYSTEDHKVYPFFILIILFIYFTQYVHFTNITFYLLYFTVVPS
jgi:hypothetical protein